MSLNLKAERNLQKEAWPSVCKAKQGFVLALPRLSSDYE